ncbi:MAG: ABC transporter permease, partial [Microbacterium gubbeenense]|uniref:ABC transporter permease n=1 Tax=Microbacterium gubbeenense TaxID=159896 RepID=UPI003F966804
MALTLDPTSTPTQALTPAPHRRTRGTRRDPSVMIIVAVVVVILVLLLGLPMSKLVMAAFSAEGLAVFTGMFTNPANLRVVGNTMLLGLLVGVCGTLVGFLFAFAQVRLKFRGKRLLHLLALVPVVAPPFAVATATITLFGRSGVITSSLLGLNTDVYGLGGLVFVLTLSFSPVAYMNLKGMLENLDPSLDEAASDLGASKARIFFTVTLPMLAPGIAGSFLLLFVEGIADLANPLVLGGDYTVLSTRAYIAVTGEFNVQAGAAYSILLIVPALLVFLVQRYWTGKKQVTSVTGKPSGRAELITAPTLRIPVLVLVSAWVAVTITVYATVVAGGFLKVPGVNNEFTLDHFRFVLAGIGSKAMLDTTVMAL